MLQLHCTGTPREIGHSHGTGAKSQVHGSIAFYLSLFQQKCNLDWAAVTREAEKYVARLEVTCPRHLDKMRGIAEGAGVGFLDVLALNMRTEIMFELFTEAEGVRAMGPVANGGGVNGGHKLPEEGRDDDFPSDGCTSLSFHPPSSASGTSSSLLAQTGTGSPPKPPI
ncbi:hypothetical protein F5883DRAFT_581500 [Diaporthe sp. PMI_573]|nr:hypothetical protein F5883DRAFT_581500 [Diaporthaceae sp. PMI_573]